VDKVPERDRAEVKALVQSAYNAPNRDVAEMIAKDLLDQYSDLYPSAMKAFQDDLEACWAYLRCPASHHRYIRTTNLLERAFGEQKRRTKTIPRFFTEKSCLPVQANRPGKLVFATLWQTSRRWLGVRMTDLGIQQLHQLREDLGLFPPHDSGRVVRKAA